MSAPHAPAFAPLAAPETRAHKAAFDAYVRKGDAASLSALETKALSANSNPDGGYTIPPEIEARVNASLKAISPIRAIAGIRQVSSTVYKKPFATNGFATGWVGETAARPETSTPALVSLDFPTMELYAMPAASPQLLDDSAVDIEAVDRGRSEPRVRPAGRLSLRQRRRRQQAERLHGLHQGRQRQLDATATSASSRPASLVPSRPRTRATS